MRVSQCRRYVRNGMTLRLSTIFHVLFEVISRPLVRSTLSASALIFFTGCTVGHEPPPASIEPSIENTIAIMNRASSATGEQWLRLHNILAGAAVMKPHPALRARVALALAVGPREQTELDRAEALMDELLDGQRTPEDLLPKAMRDLLSVHRNLLRERRADIERMKKLEKAKARQRALLVHESAAHAKTRTERDRAVEALVTAQEKLRQVTRIELKHEASGG